MFIENRIQRRKKSPIKPFRILRYFKGFVGNWSGKHDRSSA